MSLKSRINRRIKVGNRVIGIGEPIFLTAEIGPAHLGKVENAKLLIRSAAEAGFDGADIFMADPYDFNYCNPPNRDSFGAWTRLRFTPEEWKSLFDYGDECGIIVYPTPLDENSIQLCGELGVKMININSDDLNNILLLEKAAKLGVPITMHDIDQTLAEVEGAVRTLIDNGAHDIIVLHSTLESGDSDFSYETANLNVIKTYDQAFGDLGVLAGCVEHTTSDYLIFAVAALQPALISKHVKIDDAVKHDDSRISIGIDYMKTMVKRVRMVEMALGNGQNQRLVHPDTPIGRRPDGSAPRGDRNKVLVAARDIPAGKIVERDDLEAKRPGSYGGLHPWMSRLLIGARARVDIKGNTLLDLNQFEDFPQPMYKFPDTDDYRAKKVDNDVRV